MNKFEVFVLFLCVTLTVCELVGPESSKEKEKPEEEDELSEFENKQKDAEYWKQLEEVVKNELGKTNNEKLASVKEFAEAIKASKNLLKGEEKDKNMKEYTIKLLNPSLFRQSWQDMKPELLDEKGENPQDILDSLPPIPEDEEEEELTPELKQAKDLYDKAIKQLNRRTPEVEANIQHVKHAADAGYMPARARMAWAHIFGEGMDIDVDKARDMFLVLADEGSPEAHAGLGFLHATGVSVPVSQAKALVYYTVGALGDSSFAQMALAYRHWAGISVPSSCSKALDLYMKVAAKVASEVTFSGGPAVVRTRLVDEEAGGGGALDTDLIEYYQLLAEKGDVQAQVVLGQLHFQGGRGVTLDLNKALHYFSQAAKTGNAAANAFLGKIYLEGGDGIKADNETALRYFRKAAELNNAVGQSGLGLMYLQGRGVPKDTNAAFKYFTMAANQGWVDGQLYLGFMYFSGVGVRRDFKQANKFFSLASQTGHVLALYHLAHMHAHGLGVMRSCTTAVELFKNVCERGSWSQAVMTGAAAYRSGASRRSWLIYSALAERGLELAQSNAAYVLETAGAVVGVNATDARSLQLWRRAAAAGCGAARLRLGDYHYYGRGTAKDLEAAAHHYRVAGETLHVAQATFNLGLMHARGEGLAKDAHLAKRCFDLAADTAPEARLPAALALAALHAHTALSDLAESPLAALFVAGDSPLSNWDVYVITLLVGALGLVVYLRRPPLPPAN